MERVVDTACGCGWGMWMRCMCVQMHCVCRAVVDEDEYKEKTKKTPTLQVVTWCECLDALCANVLVYGRG